MGCPNYIAVAGVVLVVSLSGCAPLNHEGRNVLADFSAASVAIQDKSGKVKEVLEKHRKKVRARDLSNPAYGFKTLQGVHLSFDAKKPFTNTFKGEGEVLPRFVYIDNFSDGLSEVNTAFSDYLDLLQKLATPENLPDVDEFDEYSTQIYERSWGALHKLGRNKSHNHAAKRGLLGFSGGLLRVYTTKKHQALLKKVVTDNHPVLADYFTAVRDGIKQMALGVRDDYEREAAAVMKKAMAQGVDADHSDAISELYDSGRLTQNTLQTLQVFDELYAEIIRQHRLLPTAIEKGTMSLSFVRSRLHKLTHLQRELELLEEQVSGPDRS